VISHSIYDELYARDYGDNINSSDTYQIVQCLACNYVGFRHVNWFEPTEDWDVNEYPAPQPPHLPPWHAKLPSGIAGLFLEVHSALSADNRRLALMGLRSLLDMVANEKVGDRPTFRDKVDALVGAGVITARNRTAVLAAIDAGSAAVHRGHQPTTESLDAALDIVETILATVYHLPSAGEELKATTPPRRAGKTPPK
jgi:hypothetical protein